MARQVVTMIAASLFLGLIGGHRVTLEIPGSNANDAPPLEFRPYLEPAASGERLLRDYVGRLPTALDGCTERACLVGAIASRVQARRGEVLGGGVAPSGDFHDAPPIITVPFLGEDGGRLELTVRRSDTADSAAQRFCSELGAPDFPACQGAMAPFAARALAAHGFYWQVEESRDREAALLPPTLAHRPRLQWLRRRVGCPARAVDVGACFGGWTKLLLEVCPETQVVMVEANPGRVGHLEETANFLNSGARGHRVAAANFLLGSQDREAVSFYQTKVRPLWRIEGLLVLKRFIRWNDYRKNDVPTHFQQ